MLINFYILSTFFYVDNVDIWYLTKLSALYVVIFIDLHISTAHNISNNLTKNLFYKIMRIFIMKYSVFIYVYFFDLLIRLIK